MTETNHWGVERQIGYPLITELALSPDGRQVVYAAREPLMTAEKSEFITHLYLASTDGDPIQLTFGEHSNSGPRWSPDGQYIAFLSKRSGKGNLYVMRAAGGEAWALTHYEKTDVTALKWAPDGKQIAFLMAEPRSEEKEKATKAKNDPIVWDVDFDFTHLYVTPFAVGPRAAPEARQVTHGRYQLVDFDWLPDGKSVAITHGPQPVADTWTEIRLATVPADGSAESPADLALVADWGASPKVSPDGRWIACGTGEQPARWAFANRVVLYPIGGGEPRVLAKTPDSQAWVSLRRAGAPAHRYAAAENRAGGQYRRSDRVCRPGLRPAQRGVFPRCRGWERTPDRPATHAARLAGGGAAARRGDQLASA